MFTKTNAGQYTLPSSKTRAADRKPQTDSHAYEQSETIKTVLREGVFDVSIKDVNEPGMAHRFYRHHDTGSQLGIDVVVYGAKLGRRRPPHLYRRALFVFDMGVATDVCMTVDPDYFKKLVADAAVEVYREQKIQHVWTFQ